MKLTEIIYFGFELELLACHLQHHKDLVDHTIVVECPNTTTGVPKPLFFNDNKDRFKHFNIEHVVLPAETFPVVVKEYNQFKHQDNNWKKLMQPYASFDADWVWHNDTDEIISESWQYVLRGQLNEAEPEVKTFNYHLDQRTPYINMRAGIFHVHRLHRAGKEYVYPKHHPRGGINGQNPIGWHFTSCFSTPEELYWKAKSRPWMVQDISMELCEEVMSQGFFNLESKDFDPIRPLIPQKGPWDHSTSYLPQYMQVHLERFPVYHP